MQSWSVLFDEVKHKLPGSEDAILQQTRQEALEYFMLHGFPKAAREEWKYTRLGMFLTSDFTVNTPHIITPETLHHFTIPHLDHYRMVFVNGIFNAALSDSIIPHTQTLATTPEILHTTPTYKELEALNLAFVTDGIILHLPKDTALEKPLHLLFITAGGAASYPRNHIIMEEGSKAEIIESYISLNHTPSLTNTVMEITLNANASLTHYKHQREAITANHIASTHVTLHQHSNYHNITFTEGGTLSRSAIHIDMRGEYASSILHGIYLGRNQQHIDHYIPIYHHTPNCFSEQIYKGILDGNAKGIFYGKVLVEPGAQKTDARQLNQNLLLSENAIAYSRPELEIHADDVKCSHGSATGAVDKEALFYLRSRGIGESEAIALLIEGFVGELLESIPDTSIKTYWQAALHLWLGARL